MADTATATAPETTRRHTPAPSPAPTTENAGFGDLAPAERSIAELQGTVGNTAVSELLGADPGVDGTGLAPTTGMSIPRRRLNGVVSNSPSPPVRVVLRRPDHPGSR